MSFIVEISRNARRTVIRIKIFLGIENNINLGIIAKVLIIKYIIWQDSNSQVKLEDM